MLVALKIETFSAVFVSLNRVASVFSVLRRGSLLCCVSLCCAALACGPRIEPAPISAEARVRVPSKTPRADENYRSPNMPWWQGARPECGMGRLQTRTLSWGAVLWCVVPGEQVDGSLQNDFARLARCLFDLASTPDADLPSNAEAIGEILILASSAASAPSSCKGIRHGGDVRTYHGRAVQFERRIVVLEGEAGSSRPSESRVRYRFGCKDCFVAGETTILQTLSR